MAITEQDYLLLRDPHKARTWMLLRSDRQFHFVRVDAYMTEERYQRLIKRYPCSLKELQEMGLHVSPLNREGCTHIRMEGTGEGAQLTMYCTGNNRQYILGDAYSSERLEVFFDGQQVLWHIPPVPDGPNARTAGIIGWSLSGVSFVLVLMSLFGDRQLGRFTAVLGLLIFAVSVLLCVLWPGRFTVGGMKHEDRSGEAKYRFDMELALGAPLMVMALDALKHYTYPRMIPLLLWGAVLGVVIGVLLAWASREYRSSIAGAVGLLLFLMVLSGGIAAQLNQLFDFGPTTAYHLTVDRTEVRTGGRGRTGYACYVTMPGGQQEQFSIPGSRYEELSSGDPITIILHDGALGMEYLTIDWNE